MRVGDLVQEQWSSGRIGIVTKVYNCNTAVRVAYIDGEQALVEFKTEQCYHLWRLKDESR